MYLNKFSVRVIGGTEQSSGYVELQNKQKYKLCLRNSRQFERCDANVEIDGKHVGTWRIPAGSSVTLERPAHDDGCFTFYQVGTEEARKAQLDELNLDLGLIKVTFTPEIPRKRYVNQWLGINEVHVYKTEWTPVEGSTWSYDNCSKSNQKFWDAGEIDYDLSQRTTIYLRLVAKKDDGPRPLVERSNKIPPRLY
jgi:hypothetical protein